MVFLLTVGSHFYLLTFFIQYTKPMISKPTKPIAVRTIVQPRVIVKAEKVRVTQKRKPAPKKRAAPKKSAAPKKVVKKSNKKNKLLEELTQKISNIEPTKMIETKPLLAIPTKIGQLNIDIPEEAISPEEEALYLAALVTHLKKSLLLPEFGSVKIQLKIMEDGSVKALKVLSSKSENNKSYLEKEIPHLIFPKNEKKSLNKNTETFIFTFCND